MNHIGVALCNLTIDPETLFRVASSLTCNKRGNVFKEGMKEASIAVKSAVKSVFCMYVKQRYAVGEKANVRVESFVFICKM